MKRWLLVSLVFACGGSNREVSKIKYTKINCAESDCGVAPSDRPAVPPDGDRSGVPDHVHADPTKVASTKSPEPTCRLAAESMVALEIGNYAEPEEREPRVAKEEKR